MELRRLQFDEGLIFIIRALAGRAVQHELPDGPAMHAVQRDPDAWYVRSYKQPSHRGREDVYGFTWAVKGEARPLHAPRG